MTDWEALHTAHLGGAREGIVLWVVKGHSPPLPDAADTGGLSLTPHPRPASPASPLPSQDFPEESVSSKSPTLIPFSGSASKESDLIQVVSLTPLL